jgi:probable rRNA maturation factor
MKTDTVAPPSAMDPAGTAIDVEVSDTQGHLALDPGRLADLVRRVLAGEGVAAGAVSLALVDDATIATVNIKHLGHEGPTDVISFRFSDEREAVLSGELVVSAERALAVAQQHGIDPLAELSLYVVHGLLHLCGYDDLTASGVRAMRRREGEILAREGLTNTFPLIGLAWADPGERESAGWPD